ncbi:hypothetical protein D3C86_1558880 [compost metagenome]
MLISASEIPVARAAWSGVPAEANAPNALIIPDTVPNNPPNVPKDTKVEIIVMFFSNIGISNEVASSISLWITSEASSLLNPSFLTSWYFTKADLIAFATEPCCLSHEAIAASMFPSLILP